MATIGEPMRRIIVTPKAPLPVPQPLEPLPPAPAAPEREKVTPGR